MSKFTYLRHWLIERLGGVPLTHSKLKQWRAQEYAKATDEIRATLQKAENIYVEPVYLNIHGDPPLHAVIDNCVFFGGQNGNIGLGVYYADVQPPSMTVKPDQWGKLPDAQE